MPQADLSYSASLPLDAAALLARVEQTIAAFDPRAGACKGRAFPVETTHHDHILLRVAVLPYAHRDQDFMETLLTRIKSDCASLLRDLPENVVFSVSLDFLSHFYASDTLKGACHDQP